MRAGCAPCTRNVASSSRTTATPAFTPTRSQNSRSQGSGEHGLNHRSVRTRPCGSSRTWARRADSRRTAAARYVCIASGVRRPRANNACSSSCGRGRCLRTSARCLSSNSDVALAGYEQSLLDAAAARTGRGRTPRARESSWNTNLIHSPRASWRSWFQLPTRPRLRSLRTNGVRGSASRSASRSPPCASVSRRRRAGSRRPRTSARPRFQTGLEGKRSPL